MAKQGTAQLNKHREKIRNSMNKLLSK